jgi:hypothetical protein
MQDVFAFQQPGDGGLADGQRPEDQGAMGDRFIARNAGSALDRATLAGTQRRQFGRVHRAVSLKSAPSYHAAARVVIRAALGPKAWVRY